MIRLEHVDKVFNRFHKNRIHVIQNTSLEFDSTGLVCLLGPSGSGKTTLLNAIGGLDKVRRGKIFVNGKQITHRSQGRVDKIRNLNIGYIFQDYKLIEDMSVYDNIRIVLNMIGIKDKKEIDKRVCYVLEKVGMLRYKKRPCGMLSGGEKQRVGIARAIVKNPNIIIADEPTGNLDSRNTIEIMNIIKTISKEKLVILVTHEVPLAKFYASRIIEIEDGKVIKDYPNEEEGKDLDYQVDSTLYLKDYSYQHTNTDGIMIYSDKKEKIPLKIVVSHNNIYIQTEDHKKIEVVDETSSIEFVDDHRKKLSKKELEQYQFDYSNIISNKKLKYCSIFNLLNFLNAGFQKVLTYPVLKKFLLLGFFFSGAFVMFAVSNIAGTLRVDESEFLSINRDYLTIEAKKLNVEDYARYETELGAEFIMPTDSIVQLPMTASDFYQTSTGNITIEGSLSDISYIRENQLVYGRLPENDLEIVIDSFVLQKVLKTDTPKMCGFTSVNDFLNQKITIGGVFTLTIVGISDTNNPSISVSRNIFIPILYYVQNNDDGEVFFNSSFDGEEEPKEYEDYHLYQDKITLEEGRWPENDYEVVVRYQYKNEMKLFKEIDRKILNHKLKVVGYYSSKDEKDQYFVNSNMIKNLLISSSSNITVFSYDKAKSIDLGRNLNLNIRDSYEYSRDQYMKFQKLMVESSLISAGIVLVISFVEILLMIRSSFLSRIKEVGTLRAIGLKKKDIYIMFMGEIVAITVFAAIPGVFISAYIFYNVSKISYLQNLFVVNSLTVGFSIICLFVFHLLVGLIPVMNTMRKRPAEILSRTDI